MNKKLLTLIASVATLSAQAQQDTPYTRVLTPGDFDGDGEITVADMTHMVSIIAGVTPAQKVTNAAGVLKLDGVEKSIVVLGDMNGDNKIDEKDLLAQLDITLGKAQLKKTTLTLDVAPKDYSKRNEYGSMKDFVNRIDYPNFKVAAAVNADKFIKNDDNLFNYVVENLDEVVADNAMKMNSVVNRYNGTMNFNTVTAFVDNATAAGLNVYGHTLAWHSQQPVEWLVSLIADPAAPISPDTPMKEQSVWGTDYKDGPFPYYAMGCEPPIINGCIHFESYGEWAQFFCAQGNLSAGNYKATFRIKASSAYVMTVVAQNGWGETNQKISKQINVGTDWADIEVELNGIEGGLYDIILQPGNFDGELDLKSVNVVALVPDLDSKNVIYSTDYPDGPFPYYAMGCEPPVVDGSIHFESTGSWSQFFCAQCDLTAGDYKAILHIKASANATMNFVAQNGWGETDQKITKQINVGTGWNDVTVELKGIEGGWYDFILQPGNFNGVVDLNSVKIALPDPDPIIEEDVFSQTYTDGAFPYYAMGCEPPVVDGSIHFEPTGEWSQFFCATGKALDAGNYGARLRIKSSKAGKIKLTIQNGWTDAQQLTQDVNVTTDWQDVTVKFSDELEGGNYDLILKPETFDGIIDLNSVTVIKYVNTNPNALTKAEKKEILIGAMQKWINGIMQATKGKVKAWDMINEAISGGGNVNGYYDLQHANGGSGGAWDVGGQTFYWQDFFGSKEYGVIVEKLAREAYANVEGTNPDDLKLFINDYNLESDWDDNQKLKSLIYWIGVWEKGGAKIDGIGTQMHISYSRNESIRKSRAEHITQMFELMAATGKIVRISELDMGVDYYDSKESKNKKVSINDTTKDEKLAMAEYYQWIIQEYFRIVPKEQQWGICQWCLNDATGNIEDQGGWRNGEPVGILDLSGDRKDTYVGWAEGLKTTWK